MNYPGQRSGDVAARIQSDVVSLYPAIVHILVGAVAAAVEDDATTQFVVIDVINNITSMVQQAQASNIKVILATTPAGGPRTIGITQINASIESYGAAHGIPVINYADALCDCVTSVGGVSTGAANNQAPLGYAFYSYTSGYQIPPLTENSDQPMPVGGRQRLFRRSRAMPC